jgi:hypothetical protein
MVATSPQTSPNFLVNKLLSPLQFLGRGRIPATLRVGKSNCFLVLTRGGQKCQLKGAIFATRKHLRMMKLEMGRAKIKSFNAAPRRTVVTD